MVLLIAFILSAALFAGFLALTAREARTGSRFLAEPRAKLDERLDTFMRAFGHVDMGAFVYHFLRDTSHKLAHDIAHVSLAGVQALEALLRRTVARLRARRLETGNPRQFVEYVTHVKKNLRAKKTEVKETTPSEVE
jgi:hypothetical protein